MLYQDTDAVVCAARERRRRESAASIALRMQAAKRWTTWIGRYALAEANDDAEILP
jgi:hypothetical protein